MKSKCLTPKKIQYLLTPEGLGIVSKRGSDFLKRTVRNVVVFNQSIDIIVKNIKEEKYTTINLVGQSDLLFLLEHTCQVNKIKLTTIDIGSDDKQTKNIEADELSREVLDSYLVTATL